MSDRPTKTDPIPPVGRAVPDERKNEYSGAEAGATAPYNNGELR